MGITLFVPAAIYSLHTTELILTVFAGVLTGFLLKLLVDQWRKGEQKNESQELQTELETLQQRLSTEMIRKEEVEKGLEEEIKAAEMRNVDLQVQYAKALRFVEQLRSGNAVDTDELETEAGQQILLNLQDKIARQERSLLELEQQLDRANQSKDTLAESYRELVNTGNDLNIRTEKIQLEKDEFELQLRQQIQERDELEKQYERKVEALKQYLLQQQQKRILLEEKINAKNSTEESLRQVIHVLQTQQQANNLDELRLQKAEIQTIRTTATEVASGFEQFRDQLTNILRDTYSYEQLLLSHEGLQHSIQVLRKDMHSNEEQLKQLHTEKAELEQQLTSKSEEWIMREESTLNQTMLLESSLLQLREELTNREKQLDELQADKSMMESTLAELQQKYEEKERMARDMMTVARDMESRFAHFYKTSNGETLRQEREEIQLR
jgi:chromosome segregation ATPase